MQTVEINVDIKASNGGNLSAEEIQRTINNLEYGIAYEIARKLSVIEAQKYSEEIIQAGEDKDLCVCDEEICVVDTKITAEEQKSNVKKPIKELKLLMYLSKIMDTSYDVSVIGDLQNAINDPELSRRLEEQVTQPLFLQIRKPSNEKLLELINHYKKLSFVVAVLQSDELSEIDMSYPGYVQLNDQATGYNIYTNKEEIIQRVNN